jgi:alpha-tubulin suppressor-like RCC1 family protein
VVDLPAAITTIASGEGARHVCALATDGGVYCWGANDFGQLGVDTGGNSSGVPVAVQGAPRVSSLALGTWLTCAIAGTSSQVNCWGNWGEQTTSPGAVIPGTVPPILSVASGPQVACEASGDAGVFCWGFDDGYVGADASDTVVDPAPGTAGVIELGLGGASACGRRGDGSVTCWGTNDSGELGFASDGQVHPPTPITLPTGRRAVHLAVGEQHVCVILDDGTVACWGQNDAGQCGANAIGGEEDTPVLVPGIANATSIAAGTNHTCAVLGGTSVVCWGANDAGQLGNDSDNTGVPQPVDLGP